MSDNLSVAIDAQITEGRDGGVATAVKSLIHALGQLTDGSETYAIVVGEHHRAWLEPVLGPNQLLVAKNSPAPPGLLGQAARKVLRPVVRRIRRVLDRRHWPEVRISDGFYESLGCDVLHLPTQDFVLCGLPTVYNPHDLQHLHYPQFFTSNILAWRDTVFRAGCHFAQTIVVGSQWVKDDVVRHYGTPADKIQVIPEAPPTQAYRMPVEQDVAVTKAKYGLAASFILYPAVTWPHKNHLRLFDALARLRGRDGLVVNLVCTGSPYEPFAPQIRRRIDELHLENQVKFLGFVSDGELRAIYRLAQFLVLPTLFEANSLPIFEAWLEGTPVACSNVTALPEQVSDAAHLFDPHDSESIAAAIHRLATDQQLREELRHRGYRRVKDFDWGRTAKAYRAVYRRIAGRVLSTEDRLLLDRDWMRHPELAEH